MRAVALGYIVRGPLAGHTWHHLQYVLGLRQLGYDVYYLEDSADFDSCYDPRTHEMSVDPSYGLAFADAVFRRAGLGDRWAYHDGHTAKWYGPAAEGAVSICETADVCLNVSGVNPLRDWMREIPLRILIDTDPAFTQVRHLLDRQTLESDLGHNAFFSFAENIGRPECTIPSDGVAWQPTRQPICLDAWPATPGRREASFSTMMQWESYPALRYAGRTYGAKALSFEPYLDLPRAAPARLEVAVGGASAPRARLREAGWIVRDPMEPSRDPWTYQSFIAESKAEFTVAKQAYVSTGSGWFSDRSAEYLASGRPVVTQETGFSRWLRADHGLIAFRTPQEALEAIARVCDEYDRHCSAARAIAEEYFDSRLVLSSLLERAQAAAFAMR